MTENSFAIGIVRLILEYEWIPFIPVVLIWIISSIRTSNSKVVNDKQMVVNYSEEKLKKQHDRIKEIDWEIQGMEGELDTYNKRLLHQRNVIDELSNMKV